jgi:DNA gyrase subunit A
MSNKSPKESDNLGAVSKHKNIVDREISTEMRESFIDYAMSVITDRALPDVRDGLKPVHRRILYAMHGMHMVAGSKSRKSATVVGEVLGKYHPHGDVAVYDAMVKMAQDFSYRYPLVIGQGNFGSVDGDPPAAMRYTEAKMSKISADVVRDLEKETVDWRPNYDGTRMEPIVFPSAVPGLLLNGTLGIAVGMATNIPPHNLSEVVNATVRLIDEPDAKTEDLLEHVQGPDFPTGGILYNQKEIKEAYETGKGSVVVRGEAEIIEDSKGKFQIVITSLPYRVNKAELIGKIAEQVRAKKIDGIRDLRDESTKDIRVVIELKTGSQPQKILNYIYKHTQLEDSFHMNMVSLVDGVPQTLSLKEMLVAFISHRKEVIKRRTEYDLKKAEARQHILLGLSKALDHIDEIIKLIKKSKDTAEAHANLKKKYSFSDLQASAILEMRLSKLAGLERKKIEDELNEITTLIKELKALLASATKIQSVIKKELSDVVKMHGDERRTKVVRHAIKQMSVEDMIPEEESVLVFTEGGYIKRTNPKEYKTQKRGGVGVVDLNTKEEDFVTTFLTTSTHSELLFFTDRGKVYQMKMHEIPEGRRATKGKAIVNFLSLASDEKVTGIVPMPRDTKEKADSVLMVTRDGNTKKVSAKSFHDVRRSGIIAIKLSDGDELIAARFVSKGDHIMLVTAKGQSIRFKESDIRQMGRTAGGVRGIKIGADDMLVGASVVSNGENEAGLFVISEKGYGKQTALKEYKVQKRGGSGIKTANITTKTGQLMASRIVDSETLEAIAMSKKSQVIRLELKEVPKLGRATQGVRIMKLRAGDSIASLVTL